MIQVSLVNACKRMQQDTRFTRGDRTVHALRNPVSWQLGGFSRIRDGTRAEIDRSRPYSDGIRVFAPLEVQVDRLNRDRHVPPLK